MGLKPIIPPQRETRIAGAGWGPVKTAKPFSKYEARFKFEGRARSERGGVRRCKSKTERRWGLRSV